MGTPPVAPALAAGVGLVAITATVGSRLDGIVLHAAPLFGAASNRFGPRMLLPALVAALVAWRGPVLAERLRWKTLLAVTFVVSATWGVALALVDFGGEGLARGVSSPFDLLAGIGRIASPADFLDSFVERIGDQVVHVRGHPPGLMLALWWLREAGFGGAAAFAVIAVAMGSAAGVAALVALRSVAGEREARRAAPFLVLSPAAIWMVVSADAVYAGLGAIGCALVIVSIARRGVRSDLLALAGGGVLGAALFTSYGLALVLLVPAAVGVARRRVRPLVITCVSMLAIAVAFAGFGFWWLDGLAATRAEYAASIAASRPYAYFVFANLAAFAIVLGPAGVAGLALLRDRRVWLLVGAGVAAVLVADVSGLSKGEVERIWLPFWPWVAIAACAISARSGDTPEPPRRARWWLGAQAAAAIAVQTFVGTPW